MTQHPSFSQWLGDYSSLALVPATYSLITIQGELFFPLQACYLTAFLHSSSQICVHCSLLPLPFVSEFSISLWVPMPCLLTHLFQTESSGLLPVWSKPLTSELNCNFYDFIHIQKGLFQSIKKCWRRQSLTQLWTGQDFRAIIYHIYSVQN